MLLALFPAAATALWHPRRPPWTLDALGPDEIRLADAQNLQNALWIDARARTFYEKDHIPGAVLLNEDEWNTLLPPLAMQWDPARPVVVYCDRVTCDSSHTVAARLRKELGATQVWVLKGGWQAWEEAGKK